MVTPGVVFTAVVGLEAAAGFAMACVFVAAAGLGLITGVAFAALGLMAVGKLVAGLALATGLAAGAVLTVTGVAVTDFALVGIDVADAGAGARRMAPLMVPFTLLFIGEEAWEGLLVMPAVEAFGVRSTVPVTTAVPAATAAAEVAMALVPVTVDALALID